MFETGFETGIVPQWQIAIYPYYYHAGFFISILAIALFIIALAFLFLKTQKDRYEPILNWGNLGIAVLSSILLLCYLIELIVALYSGYIYEQFAFYSRNLGIYYFTFVLMLLPLVLAQFFWRKKYRIKLRFSIVVLFLLNLGFWFESLIVAFISITR